MNKAFAALTGILASLLVPVMDAGAQSLATYDNFSTAAIDAVKWRGLEQATANAVINTAATRRIAAGKLHIALTTHGDTD